MTLLKAFSQVWADCRMMLVVLTGLFALLGAGCQTNAAYDRLQTVTVYPKEVSSLPARRSTLAPEDVAASTVTVTLMPSAVFTTAAPPASVPTLSGLPEYPITDTTPGGITILSKGEIIVVPNPVKSPPAEWKIYAEPFYSYTVAYPPEWFLVEPTGVRRMPGIHKKIVPGLSTSISSVDLSKAPGTEPRTLNPQDALHIDISLNEEPLRAGEGLKDYLIRQGYWAESVKLLEESEHHGLPALSVHYDYSGLIPNGSAALVILIAAKDGRVYKIIAPEPNDTVYSVVFQQILDSFTILDN